MSGYPTRPGGVRAHAEAFLRICHPEFLKLRRDLLMADKDDQIPLEMHENIHGADLEKVIVTHSILGEINPFLWLLAQSSDRFEYAPKPIQMREILDRYFTCADGQQIVPLVESPGSD
jgi:hypothetical protein